MNNNVSLMAIITRRSIVAYTGDAGESPLDPKFRQFDPLDGRLTASAGLENGAIAENRYNGWHYSTLSFLWIIRGEMMRECVVKVGKTINNTLPRET